MAARSCSNANILFTLMVDRFSVALARRGYSATAVGSVNNVMAPKKNIIGEGKAKTKASSWVPDPITGYYRPENRAGEVDVAQLRESLLRKRIARPN